MRLLVEQRIGCQWDELAGILCPRRCALDIEQIRGTEFCRERFAEACRRGGIRGLKHHDQFARLAKVTEENLKPAHGHEILWQEIEHIGIHPDAAETNRSRQNNRAQ